MASKRDCKAPPTLSKDITYSNWKRELSIWQAFTSLEKKKQAPAIFLTLSGQAREAVLGLDISKLAHDDGVKNLLDCLDEFFLKDETCSSYEAYEAFEKFVRPAAMSISDYIIQFEQLYNIAKSHKMEVLDGVLAYCLLNSANLSEQHKQLVRATVNEIKYSIMKEQLKKVFTNTASSPHVREEPPVKLEVVDTFYGRDGTNCVESDHLENQEYDVYYGYSLRPDYSHGTRARFHYQRRPYRGRGRQQSRVAQWKRAGPITQRSVDQNYPLLPLLTEHTLYIVTINKTILSQYASSSDNTLLSHHPEHTAC